MVLELYAVDVEKLKIPLTKVLLGLPGRKSQEKHKLVAQFIHPILL